MLLRERGAGGLDGFTMDRAAAVKGQNAFFPKNFSMYNTGTAGRRSAEREIQHAQRAPAAVPDERHGEGGGSFLYACDARGRAPLCAFMPVS